MSHNRVETAARARRPDGCGGQRRGTVCYRNRLLTKRGMHACVDGGMR